MKDTVSLGHIRVSERDYSTLNSVRDYCASKCPCTTVCLGWRVVRGGDTYKDSWGVVRPLEPPLTERQFWWIVDRRLEREMAK